MYDTHCMSNTIQHTLDICPTHTLYVQQCPAHAVLSATYVRHTLHVQHSHSRHMSSIHVVCPALVPKSLSMHVLQSSSYLHYTCRDHFIGNQYRCSEPTRRLTEDDRSFFLLIKIQRCFLPPELMGPSVYIHIYKYVLSCGRIDGVGTDGVVLKCTLCVCAVSIAQYSTVTGPSLC